MSGSAEADPAGRWPVWRLALLLYPFAAGAVAINLFLLGLLGQAVGLAAITPADSVLLSLPLGLPTAWWCGSRLRRLMDEADGS